jgi:hypothetical protein
MSTVIQTDFPVASQVELAPMINLVERVITGAQQAGRLHFVPERSRMVIKGRLQNVIQPPGQAELVIPFPDSQLPCPVPEVVNGKAGKPIYFMASIFNVPAQVPGDPTGVWIELALELESGNYLLSPDHINKSLIENNHPFRLNFEPVDIVVYKALA